MTDNVNSPSHYHLFDGIEVYDVRMKLLERAGNISLQQADDWSRAWEYLTRMFMKNGLEDAKKARWYLNKLIDKMEFVHAGEDGSGWNPAHITPALNSLVEIRHGDEILKCKYIAWDMNLNPIYHDIIKEITYKGNYEWRYVNDE